MSLILAGTGILLLATLLLALLARGTLWLLGRRPRRYWRRVALAHVALAALHLLVTMPAVLGWIASGWVRTRPDEAAYAGPRFSSAGEWVLQSRESLAESPPAAERHAVELVAADGVTLRAFFVEAAVPSPRVAVVLVHGLFRGGLELEPVAAMFRRLGAEVLLLELRNHGGSGSAPATFGRDESLDVEAAARWLRGRPGAGERKLVLFGVSLGTAAVALAAPRIDPAGLVLDAPIEDVLATAHRLLVDSRRASLPQPFRSLTLAWISWWSGFDWDELRPADALQRLDPDTAVLLIGGEDDERVPPRVVRKVLEALPVPPERKKLWICPEAGHGEVWRTDPEGYSERLRWLLAAIR